MRLYFKEIKLVYFKTVFFRNLIHQEKLNFNS